MKLIVDTNIVFSSILNTNSTIGDILLNSDGQFEFYSVSYLKEELENHKAKLTQISNLTEEEIGQIKSQIFAKIQFISEEIIPFDFWKKAVTFVREVDMDDIAYVALSLYMDKTLIWTGDTKLIQGISSKGFKEIIDTDGVLKLREELERK
jgi:predicted nucleic acid-binding protein